MFDYKEAWYQLAEPTYKLLPANIRDLFDRVIAECAGCNQKQNLDVRWPTYDEESSDDPSLRSVFWDIPYEYLTIAARAIYFLGHWKPSCEPAMSDHGAHWKFASYADQTLREKLYQFEPDHAVHLFGRDVPPPKIGHWFEVHEGCLRYCCSLPNSWTWIECGPATPRVLKACVKEFKVDCGVAGCGCIPIDPDSVDPEFVKSLSDMMMRGFLTAGETFKGLGR